MPHARNALYTKRLRVYKLISPLNGYLTRTITTMMLLIVDHAELTWCNALDELFGMNDELALARSLEHCWMILWRMAYLEAHTR